MIGGCVAYIIVLGRLGRLQRNDSILSYTNVSARLTFQLASGARLLVKTMKQNWNRRPTNAGAHGRPPDKHQSSYVQQSIETNFRLIPGLGAGLARVAASACRRRRRQQWGAQSSRPARAFVPDRRATARQHGGQHVSQERGSLVALVSFPAAAAAATKIRAERQRASAGKCIGLLARRKRRRRRRRHSSRLIIQAHRSHLIDMFASRHRQSNARRSSPVARPEPAAAWPSPLAVQPLRQLDWNVCAPVTCPKSE